MNEETNPLLKLEVSGDTGLKQLIVNHVGETLSPEGDEVTVEMMIDLFATEFPEFLLVVAEENFIRGYQQALTDVESINEPV